MTTVTTALVTASSRPMPSDRPTGCRIPCRVRVRQQPGGGSLDGFWWRGLVVDAAADRLSLLLSHPFEAGTELRVDVLASLLGPPRRLPVRLEHIAAGPDGRWVARCVRADTVPQARRPAGDAVRAPADL